MRFTGTNLGDALAILARLRAKGNRAFLRALLAKCHCPVAREVSAGLTLCGRVIPKPSPVRLSLAWWAFSLAAASAPSAASSSQTFDKTRKKPPFLTLSLMIAGRLMILESHRCACNSGAYRDAVHTGRQTSQFVLGPSRVDSSGLGGSADFLRSVTAGLSFWLVESSLWTRSAWDRPGPGEADGEGFEPPVQLPVLQFSRLPP
jgi:hypothetical protein